MIQILRKAGSVEIYGAERSAFVAGSWRDAFCIWGFPAGRMQICFFKRSVRNIWTPGVWSIAISQSGTTRMVAEAMRLAKGSGAKMIGILGTRECPDRRLLRLCVCNAHDFF